MASQKRGCNNDSYLGIFYDILAQVISVLDVTTDIIVCVQYYQKDRMVFFGISLAILCLALIAYDMVFMLNFSKEKKCGKIALFIVMLPLSPLIPYIMYFSANPESKFATGLKKMCCFDIRWYDRNSSNKDASKLRQFMQKKIERHAGFITEALVEGTSHYTPFYVLLLLNLSLHMSIIHSISSSNPANGSHCNL